MCRNAGGFASFEQRAFPAKRFGTAEEVADVITFLLSERARWVSQWSAHICVENAQGRPSVAGW
ncbi:MAG: hypothetical protein ACRDYX_21745 [Egibacteraceae bacterium]